MLVQSDSPVTPPQKKKGPILREEVRERRQVNEEEDRDERQGPVLPLEKL